MQAIILAGGRGERLRPYTDDRPKPMVEVDGRPLIAFELGWLLSYGINQVVLSCGYRWQMLQAYLGNGSRWGLDITYAVERERLGRGGGIRFAMEHLDAGSDPVIVTNGDNITNINLDMMLAQHRRSGGIATVALVPLTSSRGIVETDESDCIVRFREKPELPHWINAGVYIFERQMRDLLPRVGDHEQELFPRLAEQGVLFAHKTRKLWRTVDTAKDLTELQAELRAGLDVPCLAPGAEPLVNSRDDEIHGPGVCECSTKFQHK